MSDEPERAEGDHEWDEVVPFVTCRSQGGPYDDDSFAAGVETGMLRMILQQGAAELLRGYPAHTANLPMIDLLAMEAGYTTVAERCEEAPEWTLIAFVPTKA